MAAGLCVVALPQASLAQGAFDEVKREACRGADTSSGTKDCDKSASNTLSRTLQNIVNILTIIVGIAAVIIIIVNGLRFVTANGDSGNIANARNGIIYALVGIAIAAVAQAVVRFVINKV